MQNFRALGAPPPDPPNPPNSRPIANFWVRAWSYQSHFALFAAIRITKLLKFRSNFKELNCLAPSAPLSLLLQVKSKIRLYAHILRLNFLSDLAKGTYALSPWLRH